MAKHRAHSSTTDSAARLGRRAATPVAALALSAAALTAVAPLASAAPREGRDGPSGNGNVGVLNDLSLLPINACGLQVPILGSILDGPDTTCANTDD